MMMMTTPYDTTLPSPSSQQPWKWQWHDNVVMTMSSSFSPLPVLALTSGLCFLDEVPLSFRVWIFLVFLGLQWDMLYTCMSIDTDNRSSADADADEIFKKLVEGMVGVTYNKHYWGCVVMDHIFMRRALMKDFLVPDNIDQMHILLNDWMFTLGRPWINTTHWCRPASRDSARDQLSLTNLNILRTIWMSMEGLCKSASRALLTWIEGGWSVS